jgi:hypothetical protein
MMPFACHCRSCQYAAGGSPTLGVVVPKAAFRLTKGTTRAYGAPGDSGSAVERNFCADCGTPLFSAMEGMPTILAVKVGGLDDPSSFRVGIDLWMAEAQPWHAPHPGATQAERNP